MFCVLKSLFRSCSCILSIPSCQDMSHQILTKCDTVHWSIHVTYRPMLYALCFKHTHIDSPSAIMATKNNFCHISWTRKVGKIKNTVIWTCVTKGK